MTGADAAHAADWRYLLPSLPRGSVLCLGDGADAVVIRAALAADGCDVADRVQGVRTGYDLAAILGSAPRRAALTAAARVRPGGMLYVEVPASRRAASGHLERALRRQGYAELVKYWPRGGFRSADLWLPLGHIASAEYYVTHLLFGSTPARRAVRAALRVAVRLRLFGRLVPAFALVATRTEGGAGARGARGVAAG